MPHSDRPIAVAKERFEDIICEVVNGLVVDVVLDLEIAILARAGPINCIIPDIFASLDLACIVIKVSFRVQVKIYSVISKVS